MSIECIFMVRCPKSWGYGQLAAARRRLALQRVAQNGRDDVTGVDFRDAEPLRIA